MTFANRVRDVADWVVGLVSARAGARRSHFRRMERDFEYRESFFAAMRSRGYRAARRKSGNTPWMGSDMSADGELLADLPVLRAHQRELERDDPIASGLARSFRNDVVGDELRAQCVTKDPELNQAVEVYWNARKDRLFPALGLNFGAVQRLLYATAHRDGGVLIKRSYVDGELVLEAIELDRLGPLTGGGSTHGQAPEDPDGWITDGVEKNRHGHVVAYWVSEAHPRDVVPRGQKTLERWKYVRVPAEACIHYRRNVDRPGQTFGVPDFYAIEQDLKDIDLLMVAALKRSQIAACLAAFIQSDQSVDDLFQVTARRYGYELDQQIEPGMLFSLYPGETVQTLVPNFPTPELVPFIITLCRRVGVAVGVSWEIVLGGFGEANYSSARSVILDARKTYGVDRHDFVEQVLDPLWRWVMEDAILRGAVDLSAEDIDLIEWQHQGYAWIDPKNESMAVEIDLRVGVRTLREVLRERGTADWRDHIDQRLEEEAYEAKVRAKLGLPAKAAAAVDPAPIGEEKDDKSDEDREVERARAAFRAGRGHRRAREVARNAN